MYLETQTLDNVDGSDVVYKRTLSENSGSRFIDVATNLSSPGLLIIKHSQQGKGAALLDRHLVQFSRTLLSAAGEPFVGTANFTLAVPRSTVMTPVVVKNLVSNLIDFLSDSALTGIASTNNLDALLRGET